MLRSSSFLALVLVSSTAFAAEGNQAGSQEQTPNVVRLGFPAGTGADLAKSKTGWEIEWDLTSKDNNQSQKDPGSLLRIVSAKFTWKDKDNQTKSMTVVRNLWMAEAFTPYDDMVTTFFDVAEFKFKTLKADKKLLGPSCVLPGEILKSANPHFDNMVYKEVHDDGLRWTSGNQRENPKEERKLTAYRGQKLMLWALFEAGNYVYVVEYDFIDDGRIVCRLGFTGNDYYGRGAGARKISDGDVHLHVGCWRMDFDLGDPKTNAYQLVQRYLDPVAKRFRVAATPFNDGREGKAKWRAEEFTSLRVLSGAVKSLGNTRSVAYDLIPVRMGSARKLLATGAAKALKADMDFVNYDFWVTHTPQAEKFNYYKVPAWAAEQKDLKGQPVTVWYNTPALHVPRGEDFGPDGIDPRRGVALTTVIEFTLRPRDLFDSTPLYP